HGTAAQHGERYPDGNGAFTKRINTRAGGGQNKVIALALFPNEIAACAEQQNNNDKSSVRTNSNSTETKRPLDILLSHHAAAHFSDAIAQTLCSVPYRIVTPHDVLDACAARAGAAPDVASAAQIAPVAPLAALISRDVTGRSTKAVITAETQ